MNEHIFRLTFIFGFWLAITVFILSIASGRILQLHFPSIFRRHLICGFVLGGISPIFIWLINDVFDEMIRPLYMGYLTHLSEMEKSQALGIPMFELQRHFHCCPVK